MSSHNNVYNLQSRIIDWLRFPLVILVVYIHNSGIGTSISKINIHWRNLAFDDLYNLLRITFSEIFPRVAVPSFFLISGYLFFFSLNSYNFSIYKKKLSSRVYSLLIPFFLWNLLTILFNLFFSYLHNYLFQNTPYTIPSITYSSEDLLSAFWAFKDTPYPIDVPLWYIRDLILLSIMSPIIYWSLKKFNWKLLFILFIFVLFDFQIKNIYPFFSSIFYFSFGAYFSIFRKTIIGEFKHYEFISYILAFSFLLLSLSTFNLGGKLYSTFKQLYIFWGIISIFNIATRLFISKKAKNKKLLSNSVFVIYAFHGSILFMLYDYLIMGKIKSLDIPMLLFISYFLAPLIKISLCIVVFYLLNIYFPRLLVVLTGKRSGR